MFYLNNDDMEEMFKQAADNYELNEEMASNWNEVRASLKDSETFVAVPNEKKRKKSLIFWWLLLIPGILLITYKAGLYDAHKNQNITSATNKTPGKQNGLVKEQNKKPGSSIPENNVTQHNPRKKYDIVQADQPVRKSAVLIPAEKNANTISFNNTDNHAIYLLPADKPVLQQPGLENSEHDIPGPDKTLIINNDTVLNDPDKNIVQSSAVNQKKKNNNYTRKAFVYAGITGSADLSFIKFQKTSAPGFGIGLLTGYHLKNGLSIETGLLYDKKSYYTKGEYFNKTAFNYLQGSNLLTANGNCHMWELPLNIGYDFNTHKKYNWFVTAGVSSYFMHKEYYDFKYEKNGVTKETANDYYHSSPNWFSVLNTGAGINAQLSNKYFLQVQPYYKIPLGTVGKGNLSLSSGGINVSIKRRLQ